MKPNCLYYPRGATRAARLIAVWTVLAIAAVSTARAQEAGKTLDSTRVGPTRQQLQAMASQVAQEAQTAKDAAVRAQKQAELARIQDRLRDGDFQPGDRIVLTVSGDSAVNDTVVVRAGRVIQVKGLPNISLQGVLHSELDSYLTKQLAQYLKDPRVEATSLVQIAVLGPVGHPGFFSVPSDMTITDAIMLAGGPTQGGDVNKTVVLRDNKVVQPDKVVRQAFASGTTLDQLNLRAGDQIVVGEQAKHDWLRIVSIASFAIGAFVSIYALTHR